MSAMRVYVDGKPAWLSVDEGIPARRTMRPHDPRPVAVIGDMVPRSTHLHIPTANEDRRMHARLEATRVARQRKGPQCRHVAVSGRRCGRHTGHNGGHR